MDEVANQLARELADAIAAAMADSPQVDACRAKAREAGLDMRITLEAVVGFVNRNNETVVARVTPSAAGPSHAYALTPIDRRFLRSLRIEADEAREAVE